MKIKKSLALILALSLLLGLAACGTETKSTTPAATDAPAVSEASAAQPEEAKQVVTIGVLLARADEFNLALEAAWKAIDEARDDVEVIVNVAQDSQANQIAAAESMIAQGVDAICVRAVDNTAASDMVKAIKAAGITVVMDEGIPDECTVDDYDVYVKSENIEHGSNVGKYLAQWIEAHPDQQLYLGYIQGTEAVTTRPRHDGIYEIVTEEQVIELDYQLGEWKADKAASIAEGWLTAYPEMNVIACANDTMACAVVETLKAANINVGTDFLVFGVDGDVNALNLIKEGTLNATSAQDARISAKMMCDAAVKIVTGEAVEFDDAELKSINPHMITLVTAENVDQFLG